MQCRCTVDVPGNEDPTKLRHTAISRLNGRQYVIQATKQQPIPRKVSSDAADSNGNKTTPAVPNMPVPVVQRSLSMDRSRSDSSGNSDQPINPLRERHPATRLPAESQLDSSEESDPPVNPSQKRSLARRHARSNRQPDISDDSYSPIRPSQKRRLTRRHPARWNRQPNSSDHSNPLLTFVKSPLATSQVAIENAADVANPSPENFNTEQSRTLGTSGGDASDSDAISLTLRKIPHEASTQSLRDRPVDDDGTKSLLLASGTEGSQDARICPKIGDSLLDDSSGKTCKSSMSGGRLVKYLTVNDHGQHPAFRVPQTGKPIEPIRVVRSAGPIISQSTDVKGKVDLMEKENSQQKFTLGNRATKSTKRRRLFAIKDIVPEAVSSKRSSFTLNDVIPSKYSKQPLGRGRGSKLKVFHNALRVSFAPVVVGPEWIMNAPLKKRKFTLADVTGTGPQEPLFSIAYALEQNQDRQTDHEQCISDQSTDQLQDAGGAIIGEPTAGSQGGERMTLRSNHRSRARPMQDS
jgi:hypothetical protein